MQTDPKTIIAELTEAQKRAMLNPRWLHPDGMDPVCLVVFTDPWTVPVAQFFTTYMDRLNALGLAARAHLLEQTDD